MIIINYHQISIDGSSSPYDLPRKLFKEHIDLLIASGFSFVTVADLVHSPNEDSTRQCAITFDDGRLGAYEHGFRILQERGIKATYFVCPDWVDKKPKAPAELYSDFMTWDDIAELSGAGNVIGSHGKSHLHLYNLNRKSALREISDSKISIEQRLRKPCEHFASPWGEVNRTLMDFVRDCGYKTLSSTVPGVNKVPYDLYRLKRLDSSSYSSAELFNKAILDSIDDHATLDVGLVSLPKYWKWNAPEIEAMAGFDMVVCLNDRSYKTCSDIGLRCIALDHEPTRELLLKTHRAMARDRQITFTPLTLRETHPVWTYLLSFLPGTSRTR